MPTRNLFERFEGLKRSLAGFGFFRRGSLVRRFMPCGKAGCACQASPPKLHGPYYQWTRKVQGKTVTVRLTPAQAEHVSGWIATGRELDRVLAEMERLSLIATERALRDLAVASPKNSAKKCEGEARENAARRSRITRQAVASL